MPYKLPLIFHKGNTNLIWGIVSLVMAAGSAVLMLIRTTPQSDTEHYSNILLIIVFTGCGIKLSVEKFNCVIIANYDQLVLRSLFKENKTISWNSIDTVTLIESPAGIEVSSADQKILIPLNIKNWEQLLDLLEEKIEGNKFKNFD